MKPRVEDLDLKEVLKRVQDPERAKWLASMVIDCLAEIEGYDAVPDKVQRKIAELVVCLYGAGYYHGKKDKP